MRRATLPGRTDFHGALYVLLAWVGEEVEVQVIPTDGGPAVALFSGILACGTEVEADPVWLFMQMADRPGEGVMLHERFFRRAELWADTLAVTLGSVVVTITRRS